MFIKSKETNLSYYVGWKPKSTTYILMTGLYSKTMV